MEKPFNISLKTTDMTTASDSDIVKIFEEMEQKAQELSPSLAADMKAYSDNQVNVVDYQLFINSLNNQTIVTTSNHVTP